VISSAAWVASLIPDMRTGYESSSRSVSPWSSVNKQRFTTNLGDPQGCEQGLYRRAQWTASIPQRWINFSRHAQKPKNWLIKKLLKSETDRGKEQHLCTCSLRNRTLLPAYRRYSSKMAVRFHPCSFLKHPITVPARGWTTERLLGMPRNIICTACFSSHHCTSRKL
jgi:hypothetical protein